MGRLRCTALLAGIATWCVACAPVADTSPVSRPPPDDTREPEIRVGVVVDANTVTLGGGDALTLRDETGVVILNLDAEGVVRVTAQGDRMSLAVSGAVIGPMLALTVRPTEPSGFVRVDGTDYRGSLHLNAAGSRILVVNRLGLEAYLVGVVNAEMGARGLNELEALRAQAVASRTFAYKMLGRYRRLGYDVLGTVADQAYAGVARELPQGHEAVGTTRGLVLTYDGAVIDAFFHSTCGGRTAAGEEVFADGRRPYLQSVSDASPDGSSWCSISPRYRWQEQWDASALREALRQTLPPIGIAQSQIGIPRDVLVAAKTGSGRVAEIVIRLNDRSVPVRGAAIRQVLRPVSGGLLRSSSFRLTASHGRNEIAHLVADGGGAGHGVGLCQWGAVGRARGGQSAEQILSTYFPGTSLVRQW